MLVVSACASEESGPDTTGTTSAVTSTIPPSDTSTSGGTTTTHLTNATLSIHVPEGDGPFPAVVLVHGGGWVGGSPDLMTDLARFLTESGFLTVNTGYALSNGVAGFPMAVDDVACAVRNATAHPDSDGSVTVVGHSAGAHLAALAALDVGVYGQGCAVTEPTIPDKLVGLAGPYNVARLGPLIAPFFG
ncbi:MAG: alpha/beta hydrolase, partial [Acidimicrobiia bacterium]